MLFKDQNLTQDKCESDRKEFLKCSLVYYSDMRFILLEEPQKWFLLSGRRTFCLIEEFLQRLFDVRQVVFDQALFVGLLFF